MRSRQRSKGEGMYAPPQVTIETITPEIAERYLESNDHNRTLSAQRVKRYVSAMKRGEWTLNGETVKFNGDGTLLDGQHRFAAIAEAGIPQQMVVVRGLPAIAQETMDTGRARGFNDVLAIRGEKDASTLASAVRLVWAYEQTGIPISTQPTIQPTPQQLLTALERHSGIRESLYAGGHRGRILLLPRSSVAAFHYLFASVDKDDADVFFNRLNDGENLTHGDPIYTLRDRFIRDAQTSQKPRPVVLAAFTIRAFGAWRGGERMTKFQWKPGGAHPDRFPRITGCPIQIRADGEDAA